MEVVGAVASCIALGQALAAVPKIVGFFQSLPGIQDEALALINEVSMPLANPTHSRTGSLR